MANEFEKFTFEQGMVVGVLVAVKASEEVAHQGLSPGMVPCAYPGPGGRDWFHRFVEEYKGRVVPEFPLGIPVEALEAVDNVFERLLGSGHIP